jgi:small-conductance mechanosensitive channel
MSEFFLSYRPHLIYAAVVLTLMVVLRFVTRRLYVWLTTRAQVKFPGQAPRSLELLRGVFNALWLVLGLLALSFLFIEEDSYSRAVGNFKLAAYLGVVAIATIVAATVTNLWFQRNIARRIAHRNDPTNLKFLRYVAIATVYVVGALFATLAFPSLRGIAQTALGGAGVLALIAGVASQEALSNLAGGVFIISFKPFKIGDVIEVTNTMVGTVVDITLRHTVIRNFDNKMIVIPNAIINKEKLINYDLGDPRCCERIEVDISYSSDVSLARDVLRQVCEQHPLCIDNRSVAQERAGRPRVRTALTRFNDSSVTIRAWAWTANFPDAYDLRCDVLETVKERFAQAGILIPFPHRTLMIDRWPEPAPFDSSFTP